MDHRLCVGELHALGHGDRSMMAPAARFLGRPRWVVTLIVVAIWPFGGCNSPGAKVPDALLYVNENRLGDISGLKNILAGDTYEVRYLDPAKAEERFGVDAMGGAVLVTLVKGIKSTPPPALE